MLLSSQSLQRLLTQGTSQVVWLSGVLLMGVSVGIFSHATPTLAAERVIFRYGIFQESFSVEEMQNFAETGQLSRLRRFQLRVAGVAPEDVRAILNQKLHVNFLSVDRTLNSLPGEFLLYQMGKVVYNRRRVAPIQSLRAAFVLSAREDNYITVLKFLQNYPLREIFVDGKKLAAVGQRVGNARARVRGYLETITAVVEQILNQPLCDCDAETGTKPEP